MRGERVLRLRIMYRYVGSSPHARGTRPPACIVGFRQRFIPACAGNAGTATRRTAGDAVHPRMRGERWRASYERDHQRGSSPHARGTRGSPEFPLYNVRFIPACAGNAAARTLLKTSSWVHPRMRGERVVAEGYATAATGSSPHARGTRHQPASSGLGNRFIPACAGNALPISY